MTTSWNKGKKHSKETLLKISKALKGRVSTFKGHTHTTENKILFSKQASERVGAKNSNWRLESKGGYSALHVWVKNRLPKPEHCACGSNRNIQLSNNSGLYKSELSDWEYLCKSCHSRKDNLVKNLG